MSLLNRILDPEPVTSLKDYAGGGGGTALTVARDNDPADVISFLTDAGLRGRGGAGFPTGVKWQTVLAATSASFPTTVVVNGAEGEPGSFKDRTLLRTNPYRVLEGALIAAVTIGADRIIVALKAGFEPEVDLMRGAMVEVAEAGWSDGIELDVLEGPSEYLYGEETGLLEVLAGRQPFPRIAPPFRQGADNLGTDTVTSGRVEMADESTSTDAPPTLVNNVETFANVPGILANGAGWFRELGTEDSPGTIICTVSGDTVRGGVGEVPMGTPIGQIIEQIGGGMPEGRQISAVLSGVSHPLLPGAALDTPASHEGMDAAGGGLGSTGFIVFDDQRDPISVAAGVSRFLAVESCGQCTPCKQDGLALAGVLDDLRSGTADDTTPARIGDLLETVTDEARCFLAEQQQRVGASVFTLFEDQARARMDDDGGEPAENVFIAPIVDLVDGRFELDESQATKQPDWTHDGNYSGRYPADRFDQRTGES